MWCISESGHAQAHIYTARPTSGRSYHRCQPTLILAIHCMMMAISSPKVTCSVTMANIQQHAIGKPTYPASSRSVNLLIVCNVCVCRSTNTSPGAGGPGHTATMARSASMALAAQAAAAASLRRHTPLTPVSPASPSHTTHNYTPGSFTYSGSLSKELATPELLRSRRTELDGTEVLSGGN